MRCAQFFWLRGGWANIAICLWLAIVAGFLAWTVVDVRAPATDPHQRYILWLGQRGIGRACLQVAARSSRTRLYSAKLAWTGLVLLNIAAVAGAIALALGFNDGNLEYREWPWPIRLIFLGALVVTAWNLIGTVARRNTEDIYLSNWYTMGGVLWTCIIAVVAILPWYQYGLGQVSVSGFYMHNAVGMWFTPLALGIFCYALPKLLSRPIYSYALGVFAFWTNLVFYPIIGAHHFLFSP
jgi:cytochrome c oxidase cbb3-type subunit I